MVTAILDGIFTVSGTVCPIPKAEGSSLEMGPTKPSLEIEHLTEIKYSDHQSDGIQLEEHL